VGSGSLDLISQVEAMIAAEQLEVPVVRRECLGRCETGPVMRIAPGGPFFTEIDEAQLVDIIAGLKSFIESSNENHS
jgi:(2Fe-2S) ferredoxin